MKLARFALILLASTAAAGSATAQKPMQATTDDGQRVVLRPDGTWKYVGEVPDSVPRDGQYQRPAASTAQMVILPGVQLFYDPHKWKPTEDHERGRLGLEHVAGDGYALIIKERLQMKLDAIRLIAIKNALAAAPDAEIVSQDIRKVNGSDVICLRIEGTTSGVPFTYLGYYWTGPAGTVQLVTYTGQNLYDEYKADFLNLLNGLTIDTGE
ncbi:MAG: hypothetical protein AB7I33_06085 [Gemmatimonadales bacterium]